MTPAVISLLTPPGFDRTTCELSDSTIADLDLDYLVSSFADRPSDKRRIRNFLTLLPADTDAIRHRQGVFRDVMRSDKLRTALAGFLPLGHELNYFSELHKQQETPFLQAVWRLGELELYVDAIVYLDTNLTDLASEYSSAGLTNLRQAIRIIRTDPEFSSLERALPDLRAGIRARRSVTIGVNLDERLMPAEVGIISVNESPIQEKTLLSRLFGGRLNPAESVVPLRKSPSTGPAGHLPLAPLFEDLADILKTASRNLARRLKPYAVVNANLLSALRKEFGFIVSITETLGTLKEREFPICFPEIATGAERVLQARQLYNPVLALRHGAERQDSGWMVLNDARVDPDTGIQIVTGPNKGGKTTYIQALGIIQVLGQSGLPVPATEARLSPVDAVLTHFPSMESAEAELGRLGEEAARLSELFDKISNRSLVLLNESLTSTSPLESESLAEDVVRGLRVFGARAAFSTHLHTLAARADALNATTEGDSGIVSLVSQVARTDGKAHRTFRIEMDSPGGTSFAQDIAREAGIDLESLVRKSRR